MLDCVVTGADGAARAVGVAWTAFPERRRVAPPTAIAAGFDGSGIFPVISAVTTFWEPWWPNRKLVCEPSAVLDGDSIIEVWVRHATWWRSGRSTANHFHRYTALSRVTFCTVVCHLPTNARHGFAAV